MVERAGQGVTVHATNLVAQVAKDRDFPVVEHQRYPVTVEIIAEAGEQVAEQFLCPTGFQQGQGQTTGLVEQVIVFPGHVQQAVEAVAQLVVAVAENGGLTFQ